MKKIKLLVLLVTISVATFYSCTDNNPIENEMVTEKSIAARTTMNELKIANGISDKDGTTANSNPFCFEFVYPITLSYNTGTTVTVSSLQGLLTILAGENPNLYVDGISFPFQVMHNGAIQTISSEGQYISLLMSCGFNTINTDLLNSFCFDIVFPITLINSNNQIVAIASQGEFVSYLNNPSTGQVQLSYPISVAYEGQIVVIDNIYELYQMINNCDDCVCTLEYLPVCVQTPTGIVEFGNFCFAQCAGFTQNDLVPCDPSGACSITSLQVNPGACNGNATTTFPLTINFTYTNAPGTTFEVRNAQNVLIGTYPLTALPLTIPNYTDSTPNAPGDLVSVRLGNNCALSGDYLAPNCNDCACTLDIQPVCVQTPTGVIQYTNACLAQCAGHFPPYVTCPTTSNFGTQLGTCFTIAYPVQIQNGGALVTVDTNQAVLQYWFPAQSSIPAFNYPITVTFGNQTVTVTSQAGFQSFIQANCN